MQQMEDISRENTKSEDAARAFYTTLYVDMMGGDDSRPEQHLLRAAGSIAGQKQPEI